MKVRCGEAGGDGLECRDAELLRGGACRRGIAVDDGDQLDVRAGLFEFAIDTKVIASEDSCSDNSDAQWRSWCHLLGGRFHSLAATRVEFEQLCDLLFGFCG